MSRYGKIISIEYLKSILIYTPDTGEFFWLPSYIRNKGLAGFKTAKGYIEISIDGYQYSAHRLAWLYMMGEFPSYPEFEIDHKNRIRDDNRWENLRLADNSQNKSNSSIYKNNTSGYKGVRPNGNRWDALIAYGNVSKFLGTFDLLEDAARVYDCAALSHHGEFASLNLNKLEPEDYQKIIQKHPQRRAADTLTPSVYMGVSVQGGKYQTEIRFDKKYYYIGRFNCEIDAAKAYDAKARELRGCKTKVNFPDDENNHE